MLEFSVGHRYQILDPDVLEYTHLQLTHPANIFTVSKVDDRGDAWSPECLFRGTPPRDYEGYCIASRSNLESGKVVEI